MLKKISLEQVFIALIAVLWGNILVQNWSSQFGFNFGGAVHDTGEIAWKLLMFTIFAGLFSKIFPKFKPLQKLLPLRKWTGIFAFLIAITHGVFAILKHPMETAAETITRLTGDVAMVLGIMAFLAMLPAFITSSKAAMKYFGMTGWKRIQKLAHVSFVLTAFHIAALPYMKSGQFDPESMIPLTIYVVGYAYLYFKNKKATVAAIALLLIAISPVKAKIAPEAIITREEVPVTLSGQTNIPQAEKPATPEQGISREEDNTNKEVTPQNEPEGNENRRPEKGERGGRGQHREGEQRGQGGGSRGIKYGGFVIIGFALFLAGFMVSQKKTKKETKKK